MADAMSHNDEVSGRLELEGRPMAFERRGDRASPLLVLAHGAGAPMSHDFMVKTTEALTARGIAVLRFNFPYMQWMVDEGRRRGPDAAALLVAAWELVLRELTADAQHGIVLGGKSMGGRIASHVAASGAPVAISGLVYLGFPLHPPGREGTSRADHLDRITLPQLFVSGDRDKLARIDLLRGVVGRLGSAAALHELAGVDHSLVRSRKDPYLDAAGWWDVVAAFVRRVTGAKN